MNHQELIKVFWEPDRRLWMVFAREGRGKGWATYEGSETELDTLLAMARDLVTGG